MHPYEHNSGMVLDFGGVIDEYFVKLLREEGLFAQEEENALWSCFLDD